MRAQAIANFLNGLRDIRVSAAYNMHSNKVEGRCLESEWLRVTHLFPGAKLVAATGTLVGKVVYFEIPDGAVYCSQLLRPQVSLTPKPPVVDPIEESIYSPEGRITVAIHAKPGECDLLYISANCPSQPTDHEWYRIYA